jgi:hypothetical protein
MNQAFVALDDGPPVRLSEDGTGAMDVALAPRGDGLLAIVLDGRTAMSVVHARPVGVKGAALVLGKDVVSFVGGSPERHARVGLATARDGRAFALLPLAKDGLTFGMTTITVSDPPRDDEATTFDPYPNGLDPAAVRGSRGATLPYFARVRPAAADPKAPRVVEVGRLGDARTLLVVARASVNGPLALDVADATARGLTAAGPDVLTLTFAAPGDPENPFVATVECAR